jgi:hypothetical protein
MSRRPRQTASSSAHHRIPRPPFVVVIGAEEIQVESLGSMALMLYRHHDKDGWRIYDAVGTLWHHQDLLLAVPNPDHVDSPSGPFARDEEPSSTPSSTAIVGGIVAALAVVAVAALAYAMMNHGAVPERAAAPDPAATRHQEPPSSATPAGGGEPDAPGQTGAARPSAAEPPAAPPGPSTLEQALIARYVFTNGAALGRNAERVADYDARQVYAVTVADDAQRRHQVGVFDGKAFMLVPVPATRDFSISFWFASTQAGGPANPPADLPWFHGAGLVNADVAGVVEDFGVTLLGGRVAFGVGKPDTTLISGALLNDGAWHQVVAMRDDRSGTMSLFIDGKPDGVCKGPTGARTAPKNICIGSHSPGWGGFVGRLDDIRCYPRQLTVAEITTLQQR